MYVCYLLSYRLMCWTGHPILDIVLDYYTNSRLYIWSKAEMNPCPCEPGCLLRLCVPILLAQGIYEDKAKEKEKNQTKLNQARKTWFIMQHTTIHDERLKVLKHPPGGREES